MGQQRLEAVFEQPQSTASSLPYNPLDFVRARRTARDSGLSSPAKTPADAQLAICAVGQGQLPHDSGRLKNEMRRMKNQLIMNQNFSLLSSRMKFKRFRATKSGRMDGKKSAVLSANLSLRPKPAQRQYASLHKSKVASPSGIASPASCGISKTISGVATELASGTVQIIKPSVSEGLQDETEVRSAV